MLQVLTGHPKVDAISQIHFEGNVVCNSWRTHIRYTNKRGTYTHHLAVMLLADIVYWHRASEIRDEETGATIGWKKRFKSDRLQKSYKALAVQMGASIEQVKEACKLLIGLGLIELSFETVPRPNDTSLGNVMFIDVHPPAIAAISYREKGFANLFTPLVEFAHRGREENETTPPLQVNSPIGKGEFAHSSQRNGSHITGITSGITTSTTSLTPPLTPQGETEGVRESEAIDVNVEVLPPEDILATAPDLNQSLQTPRKLGQENSSTAPPKIENRSQKSRSQFSKDLNGNDIFPWDLPLESPERGKKFNLQFEKHMARSLMGYPAYKNLMAGELMVKVRKHIAGGRHDPKRRDELLIEWDGFQSGETHPTSTMTAKGAARRAKIASALSLNSSEGV